MYCTLDAPAGVEILVFEHRDFPEAGVQVPAGGIEAGETVEQAALRELHEETGVVASGATVIARAREMHFNGYWCDNSYTHVALTKLSRAQWQHIVSAGEGDEGLVFNCSFVPLAHASAALHETQSLHLSALARAVSAT